MRAEETDVSERDIAFVTEINNNIIIIIIIITIIIIISQSVLLF